MPKHILLIILLNLIYALKLMGDCILLEIHKKLTGLLKENLGNYKKWVIK